MTKFIPKIIQRLLAKTSTRIAIAILFAIFLGVGSYIFNGMQENMAAMAEPAEDVTYFPPYPPIHATDKNKAFIALIQRGEYLTKAGDCIACHTNTAEKGKAFAGGLPMQTPFGIIYSPNITPDKDTGIGKWTDAQFIKAMHEGIAPDGSYYYPAFPYLYFNKVTTEDIKAIKAYLDNIPAVHQKNRENTMIFPFNWRFLQLGWRILFFHPPKQPPQATQNQGAYLVNGLGHCAMCHTPSYQILSPSLPLAAPIMKYDLTGAKIQGYLAPNITQSNLGSAADDEIVQVFTRDRLIGGGAVVGPMLEVNRDSLSYLSQQDLLSIARYLKTVKSELPPKPKADKKNPGKPTYEEYCSGCHASGAGGAPKYGDPAGWQPILKNGMPTVYTNAIKGINGMPAKGTCSSCTDEEIKQAVDYMTASVTGSSVKIIPPIKKLTLADGKRIYDSTCAACHSNNNSSSNSAYPAPQKGDVKAWQSISAAGFLNMYKITALGEHRKMIKQYCPSCSDADVIAAMKYLLQDSVPDKNYSLW